MIRRLLKIRAAKNAIWIVAGKVVQAILGLVISMLTARYMGPQNYGLITYAASMTMFLTPVAQMGLTFTLVHELIREPEKEGEILGSAILMSLFSSILCMAGIGAFVRIATPNEPATIWVCELYSLLLLAQGVELIQYWFQAKLLSKYTATLTLAAYTLISLYQIVLLILQKSVYWYAVAKASEHLMIAVGLMIAYRRLGGKRMTASGSRMMRLFCGGWMYMLSGLMVMMFAQTDRIMIKNMIGDAEMGYYSAAVVCANLSEFVFLAIIDSLRPVILKDRERDVRRFENGMSALYSIIIYLALAQSVVIAVLAKSIIHILYGNAYAPATGALRIIVWYTAFSYIGSARNVWILAEKKQKMILVVNACGAAANVAMNAVLIPRWGIEGAAFASLATQMLTNVGMGWILRPLRKNNELLVRGLDPRVIAKFIRSMESE